jgi:hypothetical protein
MPFWGTERLVIVPQNGIVTRDERGMSDTFLLAAETRSIDAALVVSTQLGTDRQGLRCGFCATVFTSRNQLFSHLRENPTHSVATAARAGVQPYSRAESRSNPEHEVYYTMQQIASPEAWSAAKDAFQQPLPRHVRFCTSSPLLAVVRPLFGACTPSTIPSSALLGDEHVPLMRQAQDLGALQIQEACSCLPALALGVQPHHYVLDLCAACVNTPPVLEPSRLPPHHLKPLGCSCACARDGAHHV